VLVKSIYFQNRHTASVLVQALVYTPDATGNMRIAEATVTANSIFSWQGWLGLNPLDQMNIWSDSAAATVWVSGAILLGAPTLTPPVRGVIGTLPTPGGAEVYGQTSSAKA
jgi:hypothetical protein